VSFTLLFDEEPLEALAKLPRDIRERIFRRLEKTKENPFHYFQRLAERPDYKLRVGDYRVIADIYADERRIHVTLIGHRRNVYDRPG